MFLHNLPQTVNIGGTEYTIHADFRTSIQFEQMLFDSELSKEEALSKGIDLYYPVRPKDDMEALEKMIWFYSCGEEQKKSKQTTSKRMYSIEHDFRYIYAAFLEQYRIDLLEEDMHWWKFRALFLSLNDCMFQRIVGYRAVDLKKLPPEERKRYKELKSAFALPETKTISEEDEQFQMGLEEALANGNIADFLKEHQDETD